MTDFSKMKETTMFRKTLGGVGALGLTLAAATPAWAQEAAEAAPAVANPGNNAWMMTATILVLLMIIPGLTLFYGGLTPLQKNMLSTMTQIGATASLAMLVWVMWGFSLAFGSTTYEGALGLFISGGSYFLSGMDASTTAATFTDEVISEYVFVSFQMTFAGYYCCADIGALPLNV